MFRLAWKNIFRNKKRTSLTMISVLVATFVSVAVLFLMGGMMKVSQKHTRVYESGDMFVWNKGYEKIEMLNPLHLRITDPRKEMTKIGVKYPKLEMFPRLSVSALYSREEDSEDDDPEDIVMQVMGVSLNEELPYFDIDIVKGRFPINEKEAIVGKTFAKEQGIQVGDGITLLTTTMRRTSNAKTFYVSGIVNYPIGMHNKTLVLADYQGVKSFVKIDGPQKIIVYNGKVSSSVPAYDEVELSNYIQKTIKSDDLVVKRLDETYIGGAMKAAKSQAWVMNIIFLLLGSIVIVNTSMMAIFERRKEIGVMKALGYSSSYIKKMFLYENAFMGAGAALLGVILAVLFSIPLQVYGLDFSSLLEGVDIPITSKMYSDITLSDSLLVFVVSVTVNVLVTIIPVRKVTKLPASIAMR